MNYPETLWPAVKQGIFPNVSGEEERRLKLAFLQGMHSGRECVTQSMHLGNNECVSAWGDDERCVIPSPQFQQRIKCGWSIERALLTPLRTWGPGRKNYGKCSR